MGAPFCWTCSYPCVSEANPATPARPPIGPQSDARGRLRTRRAGGMRNLSAAGSRGSGRRVGDLVLGADQLDLPVAAAWVSSMTA